MKKIIILILTISIFLSITVQAIEANTLEEIFNKLENSTINVEEKFTDMNNHWSNDVVGKLVDLEIINGYPDDTFKPESTIKRCEFAKIIRAALKLDLQTGNSFEDTKDHWAKDEIYTLVQQDIIIQSEYGENYDPEKNITRIEMAKMIVRAMKIKDDIDVITLDFSDKKVIKHEDLLYVYVASKNKIINGYPDNTFRPDNNAKRSEACKMIINMYNAIKENNNSNNDTSNNNQDQSLDEKLAHLYDYTVITSKIVEIEGTMYGKTVVYESDMKTCNDKIRNLDVNSFGITLEGIFNNGVSELKLLHSRDYENIPSDYKSQLDYYIFGNWYYRNTKYGDMEFTKLWVDETERWKIKTEFEFLTDDSLVYKNEDGYYTIRGILRIKYDSHENPDNIQWELEREGTKLELGVWYEADVDIAFRMPILSTYICDRDNHSKYSLSYYTYLSEFKEMK